MIKELTQEETNIAIGESFEKFRLSMTGLFPDNIDRDMIKMFYNQGYIDALKVVKDKMQVNKTKKSK